MNYLTFQWHCKQLKGHGKLRSSFLYSQETSYSEKTDLASNPISASCRLCNLGQSRASLSLGFPVYKKRTTVKDQERQWVTVLNIQ